MKKIVLLTFTLLSFLIGYAQTEFPLFAAMDGQMLLYPSGVTNIWGYGWMGEDNYFVPSPLLVANKGDSVNVSMFNMSNEAHTIHLHGLDVDQANDGVPQTSFFVFSGETANYRFRADYEGTYLYHCHVTTTLHLTMGMYGMMVIEAGNNQLYEGGPVYDTTYHFLMSDLEIAVNDNPVGAFPFHEIRPDYFMINGVSGGVLDGFNGQEINIAPGETAGLRVGSMAYSLVKMIFPEPLNATVHMSDGRVLPQSFEVGELEMYPGERFSIMLEPEQDFEELIEVQYYSMVNKEYLYSNFIPVNQLEVGIEELGQNELSVYPNPGKGIFNIPIEECEHIMLFNAQGRMLKREWLCPGQMLNLSNYSNGVYLLLDEKGNRSRIIKQ